MFDLVLWVFAIMGAMALIDTLMEYRTPRDDSDPATGRRSGLIILTDHRTGLQYLKASRSGSLIPRFGADGEHLKEQDAYRD